MFDTALAYSPHAPLLMAATLPDETWLNTRSYWLLGVVLTILAGAYIVGRLLRKQPEGTVHPGAGTRF